MLKVYNSHLGFFIKTKISASRMEQVRRKCSYLHGIDVGADGSRGAKFGMES